MQIRIRYHHSQNRMEFSVNYSTEALRLESNGNVRIFNNLIVDGETTTVNSTTVTIDDPIFTVGGDTAPGSDDGKDRGIEFRYHDGTNARLGFMGYDNSTGKFTMLTAATNSSEVFSGTKATLVANLEGDVTGNAYSATQALITGTSTNTGYYVYFGGGGTTSGTNQNLRSGPMRYNPNANQLYSLTRLDATNIYGTIQTAAQPNITSVGTLTSLNVSGDVGIGTTSPDYKLHVNGHFRATNFQDATQKTDDSFDVMGNIYLGRGAGQNSDDSLSNIGIGASAFGDSSAQITGGSNTAIGRYSLMRLTSGSANIALGAVVLSHTTTGSRNIGIGNTY